MIRTAISVSVRLQLSGKVVEMLVGGIAVSFSEGLEHDFRDMARAPRGDSVVFSQNPLVGASYPLTVGSGQRA